MQFNVRDFPHFCLPGLVGISWCADRKARQQTGAQASLTEPGQHPHAGGHMAATDAGGIGRSSRQVRGGAVPQKRQRRVSQRMQEAMEDPEADLELAAQTGMH